jgi:DNA repair protein RecO (recombination protein O)
MDWTDSGIVLGLRHFGEHSAILEALTLAHGRHLGLVRGATSKRLKGALEPGNVLTLHWRARLDQQLGNYAVELASARAQQFFHDGLKLAGLNASCAVVAATLPEREAHTRVYEACDALLTAIAEKTSPVWVEDYVHFEIVLLEDLGFGLDLTQCAVTGAREGLAFVSPKTGRAVTAEAAGVYRERLLKLPRFLTPEDGPPSVQDLVDGLALTAFFLERVALEPHGTPLPMARVRLSERLAAAGSDR